MSRRPEHLLLRGSTYYFRMPVPEHLRSIVGMREIKRSLGTGNFAEARRMLAVERLKAHAEIEAARRQSDGALGRPKRRAKSLAEDELWQLMSRWFVARERRAITLGSREVDASARLEEVGYLSDIEEGTSALASVHGETKKLLAHEGVDLDVSSPSFARLTSLMQEAMIEHEKRIVTRFSHGLHVQLNPRFSNLGVDTRLDVPVALTLGSLAAQFDAERAPRQRSPTAKLRRDAHRNLLLAVLGEGTLVSAVTRDDAKRVRDVLARWPANSTKRFRGLSVSEVLAKPTEELGGPIKAATANAYLQTLCGMFEFAVRERLIASNPALGLHFQGGGHAEGDRHPFDATDLTRIFSAPLYVGCQDDAEGYAVPGNALPRRARFWVPLLALFTGLRLNEICLLREDDVAEVGGVSVLLIRTDDPGKTLKTKASERLVPIHLELQRIGFLEYVKGIRETHSSGCRLFPDISQSSTGYASNNFSKWFARFLKSAGVTDRQKTFHSFRHTFRDGLQLGHVAPENANSLGGWAVQTTAQRYGGSRVVKAKVLAPEMAKLRFPGLTLNHLHRQ